MTSEAVIVMQLVVGGSLVLAVGSTLLLAIKRLGGPADPYLLVGFFLISGGGLAMVALTGSPDFAEEDLFVYGLKLGWVTIVTGIAYLACLGCMNMSRHRRTIEALAHKERHGDTMVR